MKALVTGAAGFIGSTLSERLICEGWSVRGVDCLTPYYSPSNKRQNLMKLQREDTFDFHESDLLACDLSPLFEGVDTVFHLAGQPGVRLSWSEGFETYLSMNVAVTQRLLEEARRHEIRRFVFASSSSVYGNTGVVPTPETSPTNPFSPYGVTKLAGEHLCTTYAENFGVPTVSLRFFTVYGPRQRPDMALHRMIESGLADEEFTVFGDGEQVRDFTFVDDVVEATIRACQVEITSPMSVNIAGSGQTTLKHLVEVVGEALGRQLDIAYESDQPGDVRRTGGDIEVAKRVLKWEPRVTIEEGVARQVAWHRKKAI